MAFQNLSSYDSHVFLKKWFSFPMKNVFKNYLLKNICLLRIPENTNSILFDSWGICIRLLNKETTFYYQQAEKTISKFPFQKCIFKVDHRRSFIISRLKKETNPTTKYHNSAIKKHQITLCKIWQLKTHTKINII